MENPIFETCSFWDSIGRSRPVILYGTGNGADKIIDRLAERGIAPSGIFASDGFVRDRSFRDFKVTDYKTVRERFGDDITVLLSFGTDRPEVIHFIEDLDGKHELIIPEVPLYGGELFDTDYLRSHKDKLFEVYSLFSDEFSKRVFCDCVNFRLTGKLKYLKETEPFKETVNVLLNDLSVTRVIDGGAYTGDTADVFLNCFDGISQLTAIEPDPNSFKRLEKNFKGDPRIRPLNCALGSSPGETEFSSSSNRGAGKYGGSKRSKTVIVRQETIDRISAGRSVDLIKLDVEGNELASLEGAEKTIAQYSPALIVSLYHKTDDLFEIPLYLKSLNSGYEFYLRHPYSVPMWDLNLIAVKR